MSDGGGVQAVCSHKVTERMVEEHRRRVYEKLGVGSAAEVATMLAEARGTGLDLHE